MIHKVAIRNQLAVDLSLTHEFEQVVDTEEEAMAFGETCAHLMQAYLTGFASADLKDDD